MTNGVAVLQRLGLLQSSSAQSWLGLQGSSSGLIVKKTIRVDIPVDKYPTVCNKPLSKSFLHSNICIKHISFFNKNVLLFGLFMCTVCFEQWIVDVVVIIVQLCRTPSWS